MGNKKILGTDLALDYKAPTGICEDTDLKKENRYSSLPEEIRENLFLISDPVFGKPYKNLEDIARVTGIKNIKKQSLINRIMTHKGELKELGHPEYGSRHHELMGEPNTESNRNLIKFHILECLSHEPRIERILKAYVKADTDNRNLVRVYLEIKIIGVSSPINLVVPFMFEV